jgi:regulator of replication initiation timing
VDELKALARKAKQPLRKTGDYDIHLSFVNQAERKTRTTELMQRRLERKYRRTVEQFTPVDNEADLKLLWEQAVAEGNVGAAYWALLTHPNTTSELRRKAFGDIHMLSHLAGRETGRAQRRSERLAREAEQWRAEVDDAQQQLADERAANRELARQRDEAQQEAQRLRAAANGLEQRVMELEQGREVRELNDEVLSLSRQVGELSQQLEQEKKQRDDIVAEEARLSRQNRKLTKEKQALTEECALLEALVAKPADADQELDETDADQICENCSIRDDCEVSLWGKRILYLGGRRHLVRHYRELVQRHGGQFLHHQGGQEGGKRQLPEVVARADVVLCPVDCISHEATLVAKGVCKRATKPFIPLRSSGLSSLQASLRALARTSQTVS